MCFVGFGGGGPPVDNTPGPESDTVFVQGLGQDITKEKIAEKFGTIGVIKVSFSRWKLELIAHHLSVIQTSGMTDSQTQHTTSGSNEVAVLPSENMKILILTLSYQLMVCIQHINNNLYCGQLVIHLPKALEVGEEDKVHSFQRLKMCVGMEQTKTLNILNHFSEY